jgi:hypothetical protein
LILDTKQNIITGAATTITNDNLTIDKVLISKNLGKVVVSSLNSDILPYLTNRISDVQTQLNSKQPNITVNPGAGLSLFPQENVISKLLGSDWIRVDRINDPLQGATHEQRRFNFDTGIDNLSTYYSKSEIHSNKQGNLINNGSDGIEIFKTPNRLRKIHTVFPLTSIINQDLDIDLNIDLTFYYNKTDVNNLLNTYYLKNRS